MQKRLSGLDYLRGICAMGIMIFHYCLWNYGVEPSEDIFTRVGMYGVSIFYVLSGLTLYHVYHEKLRSTWESVMNFYIKRLLRIFPLLWLSVFLTVLVHRRIPETDTVFTNLTGLFAFYKWEKTITYGAWSIGNELSFYLIFPLLVLFLRRHLKWYFLMLFASFISMFYFAFWVIKPTTEFILQWEAYTNPLNQFFLFIAGVGLGAVLNRFDIKSAQGKLILIFSLGVFAFFPTKGNRVELVTGINRLVFVLSSIGICAGIYKSSFHLNRHIHRFLLMLGHASYSVYLLHPLVYRVVSKFFEFISIHFMAMSPIVLILSASIATVAISYFVYLHFERYFTSMGKKKAMPRKMQVSTAK